MSPKKKRHQRKRTNKTGTSRNPFLPRFFIISGILAICGACILLGIIFFPIVREELLYRIYTLIPASQQGHSEALKASTMPIDPAFSILIPKIRINEAVVPDVDPFDSRIYQPALTKGVAHALGSSKPDQPGNVFLFSHSSVNFLEATRFNSIFYLLSKLEKGDEVTVYYKNIPYRYIVTDKRIVDPTAINYLKGDASGQTLTLMTCWPPGTNFRRLIILAELQK